MLPLWIIISLTVGVALGAAIIAVILKRQTKEEQPDTSGEIAVLNERLQAKDKTITEQEAKIEQAVREFREQQTDATRLRENIAKLETTLSEERKQTHEKLKLLDDAKKQLADQFKILAGEIFDAKSKRFNEQSRENLDSILKPLREKLGEFEKKVEDTHEKGVKERASLGQLVKSLSEQNKQLSDDAKNLTKALRGEVKTQGNWGEMVLERVLEASGLEKGREYVAQESITTPEGRRLQPDVVVHLPENRHIVIDAKVSLTAYERFTAANDDQERTKALKEHLISIRNHLRELSDKHYADLLGDKGLDFIFMFIPIESAFTLAMQSETEIFYEANRSRIIVVTPSTLLASLKTISYLWRQEAQNRNAAEIARLAGKLYDKLANFVDDLQNLGSRIEQTRQSYDLAMNKLSTGRGNAITTADKIRQLGAKTNKQLPQEMIDEEQNFIDTGK